MMKMISDAESPSGFFRGREEEGRRGLGFSSHGGGGLYFLLATEYLPPADRLTGGRFPGGDLWSLYV